MVPKITILFKELSNSVLTRGERGIVGLVMQDTVLKGTSFEVVDGTEIPSMLSEDNKKIIESALIGNDTAPKKILCYIMTDTDDDTPAPDYNTALEWVENSKANIVAFCNINTDSKETDVVTAIKAMRENKHRRVMAILPNYDADYEGIINWNGKVYENGTEKIKEKYTARIAGAIAGTSVTNSICNMVLNDVDNCERLTDTEIVTKDENGECFAVYDGENVVINDDRTSLTTTTADKGESFKTIKLVRDMDMVYEDIYRAIQEGYKGKVVNDYDNQVILLQAINAYLATCVTDGIFSVAYAGINIEKKREWVRTEIVAHPNKFIKPDGTQYIFEDMSEQDFKECYSSNKVFIKVNIGLNDMMKDFEIIVYV